MKQLSAEAARKIDLSIKSENVPASLKFLIKTFPRTRYEPGGRLGKYYNPDSIKIPRRVFRQQYKVLQVLE